MQQPPSGGCSANAVFDARELHNCDPVRNLDLLRACAVLLVVFSHLIGNGLKLFERGYTFPHDMGRLGVMIFFVHTSLVLMLSMERMKVKHSCLVRSFYIRRAFRIYPLSVVGILAAITFAIPVAPFATFSSPSLVAVVSNMALLQNLTNSPSLIGPLWSLPYEVQMYAALPLLFFVRNPSRIRVLLVIMVSAVLTNAVGLSLGFRVFRILDYVPCFMGGIFAYALLRKYQTRIRAALWPFALGVLLTAYIVSGIGWPIGRVFYAEWSVCAALGVLIPWFHDMPKGPLTTAAHYIAKYSYGIYLFHMLAMWFVFDTLGGLGAVFATILSLALTAILAVAGYHLIEAPMVRVGKRIADRSEVLGAVVGTV